MPDLLVVTKDTDQFHRVNIRENPSHYSAVAKLMGSKMISDLNESVPFVHYAINSRLHSGLLCKYGVLSLDSLIHTITTYESFYLAGRLQKPIATLEIQDENAFSRFQAANELNRKTAVALGVLLSTSSSESSDFKHQGILETIVGLSYLGDIRMGIAEAPSKIQDIVKGQGDELEALYGVLIEELLAGPSTHHTSRLISSLPAILKHDLPNERHFAVCEIKRRIRIINKRDSFLQVLKGLALNPPADVLSYVSRKLTKRWRS